MKEYERLTNKNEYGNFYKCKEVKCQDYCPECTMNDVAIERLAELEDKIENGTLIERPSVKKGDRIWLIRRYWDYFGGRTKKEVVGRIVKRILLNNDNSLTFSCLAIHKGTKLISIVKSTTFNKTWFLTKSEAEERLKEKKNEKNI